jgi:hypothetical protein
MNYFYQQELGHGQGIGLYRLLAFCIFTTGTLLFIKYLVRTKFFISIDLVETAYERSVNKMLSYCSDGVRLFLWNWASNGPLGHPQIIHEWIWSSGGMILTGENRRTRRNSCPSATLSTTNTTWTYLGVHTRASVVRSRRLTAWAMARPWMVLTLMAV